MAGSKQLVYSVYLTFCVRIEGKKIKVQSPHWYPPDSLHADPDILIESRQY